MDKAIQIRGRDGQATLARAVARAGGTQCGEPSWETVLKIEVEECDGTRWVHTYGPDGEGWPEVQREAHARARSIQVVIEDAVGTMQIRTDVAIIEGSFACCDDAMVVVTEDADVTQEQLAQLLDETYGDAFAMHRSGLDERTRERMIEHRETHEQIALLAAAHALARSAKAAQAARIALLWSQHIDCPRGAVTPGVYTVRANGGVPIVEHEATNEDAWRSWPWRAMQDAPTDGTRVRVRYYARDGQPQWTHAMWNPEHDRFVGEARQGVVCQNATGWLPSAR